MSMIQQDDIYLICVNGKPNTFTCDPLVVAKALRDQDVKIFRMHASPVTEVKIKIMESSEDPKDKVLKTPEEIQGMESLAFLYPPTIPQSFGMPSGYSAPVGSQSL